MSRRLRILLLHRTLRQSGAARQIHLLYRSLDRTLFDPSMVVTSERRVFFREGNGNEALHVLTRHEWNQPGAISALVNLIRKDKPDIIQSFNTDANLIAWLATRRAPVPRLIASLRNTRKSALEMYAERRMQAAYDSMVVNSRATREEILTGSVIDPARVHVIHNGVDTGFFAPMPMHRRQQIRAEMQIPENAFVLVSVGRIAEQKNHACTVRALALLWDRLGDSFPLIWYCLGLTENLATRRELLGLVDQLGVRDLCRFVDSTPSVPDYYALADVSVLSSRWEGMPNALLESLACERLPVVADSADNDQILDDGMTGLVYPGDDAGALAERLLTVIRMSEEQKRDMERRGREVILSRYNLEAMVRGYQSLYLGVASPIS